MQAEVKDLNEARYSLESIKSTSVIALQPFKSLWVVSPVTPKVLTSYCQSISKQRRECCLDVLCEASTRWMLAMGRYRVLL